MFKTQLLIFSLSSIICEFYIFSNDHLKNYSFFKGIINCLNFCGDWDQYKDNKCIKILNKKETASKSLEECLKLDNTSSLISISDQEEQDYINQMLKKYSNVSMFAWIGMKYNRKEYKWMDGMDTQFDNWSDEAVRVGADACVKMSLMSGTFGKWIGQHLQKESTNCLSAKT